ncbi:ATP-binding protein [candidate division KSB1 bacterium]|nr:ATP-binding protein [candidate division KSB1 bacterium]
MELGAPSLYSNKSFSNIFPADVMSSPPEAENFAKKKMREPADGLIEEAWAPMSAFLDAMQEAVSGVDEYLCVKYWNAPMARLTGVAPEEALHRPLFSLLPRDFERHLEANLRQLFHQQTPRHGGAQGQNAEVVEGEFAQSHGNSEFFDFSYRMRILPTSGNRGLVILTLRPASERRSRQRRFKPQEPLGLLGTLSAGIAQELTNPLEAICSRIDNIILLTGNNWDARLEDELHSIITEVYRISYLVNNILTLSSHQAFKAAQVNINHLVPESIILLEHTLNRKIACATVLQDDLPLVSGDPVLLQTVLQNILRYAVEAAGDDTVPKIQTAVSDPLQRGGRQARGNSSKPALAKGNKKPSPQIVVKIEDRGAVMAPKILAQLFDPIASSKQFGIAVGLGLFLSKKIVESHHGMLQVSSEPGRGTIFTITLNV